MGTVAHEWSHVFDSQGHYNGLTFKEVDFLNEKTKVGSGAFSAFERVASSSDQFLEAFRKDMEILQKAFLDNTEKIAGDNSSLGIQDAIGGFWGRKETSRQGIKWGHADAYWDRRYNQRIKGFHKEKELQEAYTELGMDASNQAKVKRLTRVYENASEAWANISSAETCQDAQLKWIQRCLPNSYAAYKEIISLAAFL